mmetsp:Transcript_6543/g.16135  ORF Transcript_6543/g.16135 Transcript_6543/m.16135 type:complete len:82 (-) Transcript_6543:15-260(-)
MYPKGFAIGAPRNNVTVITFFRVVKHIVELPREVIRRWWAFRVCHDWFSECNRKRYNCVNSLLLRSIVGIRYSGFRKRVDK